jgi:hypothetical protein
MKIAILIYGRLNKSLECYNYIMSSLSNYDSVDFFCSSDNSDNDTLSDFINKYKPLCYINDKVNVDNFKYFYDFPNHPHTHIDNMIRHFINKKRVYDIFLKYNEANNKQYDVIMYLRADLQINDNFNFEYPKDNNIYIPIGQDYVDGINDQIAYGNESVMKIYSQLIFNCKLLLSNNLAYVHPETLTLANLKYNNLIINRFALSYNLIPNRFTVSYKKN